MVFPRSLFASLVVVCLVSLIGLAQEDGAPAVIVANQNRTSAGSLNGGVLNVHLEIQNGVWHPEADDGPRLFVPAFAESGKPAQIPGPMLRMPQGTTVHVTVTNKLTMKATVHGFNTRPGTADAAFEVPPGETRERTFVAGGPGTYYYWARTTPPREFPGLGILRQPFMQDAQLNGAFVVDAPGATMNDRVFVINTMIVGPDVAHEPFEVVTINGKSYPFTEPLEYTMGDTIRWRVINPSFSEHPMHLHGAFFKLLTLGDDQTDTQFAAGERQSVVTEDLKGGGTMMAEWTPAHPGRWLFHCHFQFHMSSDERLPVITRVIPSEYRPPAPAATMHHHEDQMAEMTGMQGMHGMAGLVLAISVKPKPGAAPVAQQAAARVRKIDLVLEPNPTAAGERTFTCSVREKNKVVVSKDHTVGPPIIVTRGEPTEVTVVNHLKEPTTIHWHGLELESYFDGVAGAGVGDQVAPQIAPGSSFVARFTPNRAGTFIYHTHSADPRQLSGGIYGALIVLEPGQSFDVEHDKLLVIGTRDMFFNAKRITINGQEKPEPLNLVPGETYRLRIINMAANLPANFRLGSKDQPVMWREIAKDGAVVPQRLSQPSAAFLHIASGETYDFEFRVEKAGEIPLEVENPLNKATLVTSAVVQPTNVVAGTTPMPKH